ncbi:MAG TPA: hypothetical protein VKJ01_15450 [Candidatus Solibacter sp.]|jgi:xanthine dehydrogenase iron-sulfur cluster and FAD-binding subunit A|nr:hypothetical protein [Candidatus Solibacter sp.]
MGPSSVEFVRNGRAIRAEGFSAQTTLHPIGDHRGSAAYRLALAQSLLAKFWWQQQAEAAA